MTCATDGRWKLVRDPAGDRVYDTAADPAETRPLDTASIAGEQDAIARLRRAVDGVLDHTAGVSDAEVGGRGPEITAGEAAALEERMRLLGYL